MVTRGSTSFSNDALSAAQRSASPAAPQVLPPNNPVHPPEANGGGADQRSNSGGGVSATGARVAWSGGRIVTSDKAAVLASFIEHKCSRRIRLSDAIARRAAELDVSVPETVLLPTGWMRDDSTGRVFPSLRENDDSDDEAETLGAFPERCVPRAERSPSGAFPERSVPRAVRSPSGAFPERCAPGR